MRKMKRAQCNTCGILAPWTGLRVREVSGRAAGVARCGGAGDGGEGEHGAATRRCGACRVKPLDLRMVEVLAGFAFDMEQIGSVFGRTAAEMESECGDLIRASWPDEAEYVRRRVRRLLRHPGPHREAVKRAHAAYLGRAYYPTGLATRIYAALRSHVVSGPKRHGVDPVTVTRGKLEQAWGYEVADLMDHVERLFRDGMSWDNWGEWHIDHIRPRASFGIRSLGDEAFRECWALSNLQPLWAKDNIRKGAKYG